MSPATEWKRTGSVTEPVGTVFRIQRFSIHDGPGIRTTVFLQGCPLRCRWCHNPEGIPPVESGRMSRDVSTFTSASLADEVEKDTPFFDRSGGGVTFSGGEPLLQPAFLAQTLEELRQREIHTCVDTSGFAPAETLEPIIPLCDTFLFDLKLIHEVEHREYTGVSVTPVLHSLELLSARLADINIRIPLIPGITDTGKNIDGIIGFLVQLDTVRRVNILPFHGTGEGKYEKLGLENPMKGVFPPSEEKVQAVKEKFENSGFIVSVGG